MNISDFIIKRLEKEGVKHAFMVSGGGGMFLIESLGKSEKIKYIPNHHEQASSMAAEAYSRVSQNLGVAIVTTGPAGTNALTGFVCAWTDSVPLLIISGQAKTTNLIGDTGLRQRGFHEVNISKIVQPVAKFAITITDVNTVEYNLEKAIFLAKNDRPGPVWLDIPIDIQSAEYIKENQIKFDQQKEYPPKVYENKIEQVIELIQKSERPIIIAGHGIKLSKCKNEFLKFVELFKIPVVTTRSAFDVIESTHPLRAGFVGNFGQRAANFALQNADLIISLGSRLAITLVGYESNLFAREAKKIVVDIDLNQLNSPLIKIDYPIHTDVKLFIKELLEVYSNKLNIPSFSNWISKIEHWKTIFPNVTDEMINQKKYVNSYYFYSILSNSMRSEDILVWDQGAAYHCAAVAFNTKKDQIAFSNEGFTPMGYGLPASIGACLASGNKEIISVNGDGGIMLNIQELQTIVHFQLPIKIFIFNNDGYTSIKHTQDQYFNGHYVGVDSKSGLSCPDFVKVSEAFGIPAYKIEKNSEIQIVLDKVLKIKGPVVIEVFLDPIQLIVPRIKSEKLENGTMKSKPLEDMFPYLDRDQFQSEMIIKPIQ